MGKMIIRTIVLLVPLLASTAGYAAKISWILPISYADQTPIDPDEVEQIVVKVYAGPSRTGPWKWVATSLPGATSAAVLDPMPGHILWYTAKTSLHGAESDYAAPIRKINLSFPVVPTIKKSMKWMITPKKMVFLSFLLLLAGMAGLIRHRRKRKNKSGTEASSHRSTAPSE